MSNNTHYLGLVSTKQCNNIEDVSDGKKTIEGRKVNDKIKSMKKGDTLVFKTSSKNIECEIKKVVIYKSFDEFMKTEDLKKHMPCMKTKKGAIEMYESFNKEKKPMPIEGEFAAIHIKLIRQIFYRGVQEPWFTFIKENKKKIEGRLGRGSFIKMKKGDKIVWIKSTKDKKAKKEMVSSIVQKVEKFKSFEEMIKKTKKLEELLPEVPNKEEALKVYRKYFSEELEKSVGKVVAVHIKLEDK